MRQRTRKLIGAAILAVFVPLYAFTAAMVGDARMAGASELGKWAYYAIAGLLWVIPAGVVVTWMQWPDKS
jgi:hypothetical protein